jgi:hypothetical protein
MEHRWPSNKKKKISEKKLQPRKRSQKKLTLVIVIIIAKDNPEKIHRILLKIARNRIIYNKKIQKIITNNKKIKMMTI